MQHNKFKKTIAIIALTLPIQSPAQDLHFSQFYENAMLRNPALTGIFSGDYKAGVNYRRQWGSIGAPFQTMLASAEVKVPVNEVNDFLSGGICAVYDKAGQTSFSSLQIIGCLNYNKSMEDEHRSYISAGISGGYAQQSVSTVRMIFGDQYMNGSYDPGNLSAENISGTNVRYFDLGAGVSFNSSLGERNRVNYYLGAAAYHINKPKVAFDKNDAYTALLPRWNANAGMQWMIEEHAVLSLHGNYSRMGANQEIIAGFLASWRNIDMATRKKVFALYGGVFYRWNDAWIPTLKLDYKTFSFTFSYDMTTSGLTKANNGQGGFEISVFAKGHFKKVLTSEDRVNCPRFEDLLEEF